MYSRSFIFLAIIIIILSGMLMYGRTQIHDMPLLRDPQPLVVFNDKTPLRVTVVKSDAERILGLSGRESLGPTEGMLFVFPKSGYHGIWMKEMRFPIDILWLNDAGIVVDRVVNAQPDSFPHAFEPAVPARYVIETNAYFLESFNIKVGDTVALPPEVRVENL